MCLVLDQMAKLDHVIGLKQPRLLKSANRIDA